MRSLREIPPGRTCVVDPDRRVLLLAVGRGTSLPRSAAAALGVAALGAPALDRTRLGDPQVDAAVGVPAEEPGDELVALLAGVLVSRDEPISPSVVVAKHGFPSRSGL